jgi:hypothetical protein
MDIINGDGVTILPKGLWVKVVSMGECSAFGSTPLDAFYSKQDCVPVLGDSYVILDITKLPDISDWALATNNKALVTKRRKK